MAAANSDKAAKPKRKPRGRPFEQGQSGNPTGRPKVLIEIRDLARKQTTVAMDALVEITRNPKAPAIARVAAANAILDRGWGKPVQPLSGDDAGAALRIVIEQAVPDAGAGS